MKREGGDDWEKRRAIQQNIEDELGDCLQIKPKNKVQMP